MSFRGVGSCIFASCLHMLPVFALSSANHVLNPAEMDVSHRSVRKNFFFPPKNVEDLILFRNSHMFLVSLHVVTQET